jgi:hypothetical protein
MSSQVPSNPTKVRKLAVAYLSQDGRCSLCGNPLAWGEANLDHILPVSKGGGNHLRNLAATHVRCNAARGDNEVTLAVKRRPVSHLELRQFLGSEPTAAMVRQAKVLSGSLEGSLEGVAEPPLSPMAGLMFGASPSERKGVILQLLDEQPGISVTQLAYASGIALNTLVKDLRRLQIDGWLFVQKPYDSVGACDLDKQKVYSRLYKGDVFDDGDLPNA